MQLVVLVAARVVFTIVFVSSVVGCSQNSKGKRQTAGFWAAFFLRD